MTYIQVLYDVGKITESAGKETTNTLPELIINKFDQEQVWAGIELQNQNKLEKWKRKVNKIEVDKDCSLYIKIDSKEVKKTKAIVDQQVAGKKD